MVLAIPGLFVAATLLIAGQTLGLGQITFALLIAGGSVGGLGLLLFTAGTAVYVFAPLRPPADPSAGIGGYGTVLGTLYLTICAAYAIVGLYALARSRFGLGDEVVGPAIGRAPDPGILLIAALAPELCLLAMLYVRFIRPGVITRADLGLETRKLGRRLALGLLTAIALLVAIALAGALLAAFGVQQNQYLLFQPLRSASTLQIVAMFLIATLGTGLVEESFFRGYVFRALYRAKGALPAYLVSSFLFAAAHGNLAAFLPLLAAGLILAYVYHRSGSIIPNATAHAINNGVALVAILFLRMA